MLRSLAFGFGIPLLFVFLWSTGFVSARLGLPSIEPFTFLALRMALVLLLILLLLPFIKVRWPGQPRAYFHLLIVGLLIHGLYLGGVFAAIDKGLPSAVAALIVGLQPIVTAGLASLWLQERLTAVAFFGFILGFVGVTLVIFQQLQSVHSGGMIGIAMTLVSLAAISVGTVYQKRFCSRYDLLAGVFIQYTASGVLMACLALAFESRVIDWSPQFIFALGWSVIALSLGAVLLLMWLIRHGEAGRVASLFYLVPPFTVVEAWILFNEAYGVIELLGIALCVVGVAVVAVSGPIKR